MRRKIRLTEGDLHRIVKRCINEAKDFQSAETFGEFLNTNDRAHITGLKSKKGQMDSDWNDLSDAYPYGWGRDGNDYYQSYEANLNGEYPFTTNDISTKEKLNTWDFPYEKERIKYNRQADSRPLHRKGSLNRAMDESKLRKLIKKNFKKVLREAQDEPPFYDLERPSSNYNFIRVGSKPHYYAEVYELDGDAITSEEFSNLKDACMWAKSQVEGRNAPYKGYASEVFHDDGRETGYYYGNC